MAEPKDFGLCSGRLVLLAHIFFLFFIWVGEEEKRQSDRKKYM